MPRILLVEDDPFAQDLVTSILLSAGIETNIASDGFMALKLMREHAYPMALVDYHLPEMDGYALAKLLRETASPNATSFRLVGLTADRNGLAARRGSDALFDSIIVKPFEPQELIDVVTAAMTTDTHVRSELRAAATALLANPGAENARAAARIFWRSRGLDELPRIRIVPEPTPRQISDLGLCFDIVADGSEDLVMVLDGDGLAPLTRLKEQDGSRFPPVVTIARALAPIVDLHFDVAEPQSWSQLADCLLAFWKPSSSGENAQPAKGDPEGTTHHDREAFLKVASLFGRVRTDMLLAEFAQALSRSFERDSISDHERHKSAELSRTLASTAGTLGFVRLAQTCRELETAIHSGDNAMRPLGKVRAAKLRSLRTIATLREFGWGGSL